MVTKEVCLFWNAVHGAQGIRQVLEGKDEYVHSSISGEMLRIARSDCPYRVFTQSQLIIQNIPIQSETEYAQTLQGGSP